LAGAWATISLGVSSLGGAAPTSSAAAPASKIERIILSPSCGQSSRAIRPPLSATAMYLATLMLLGSGELGREFAIAAKRLGCRVIACDRYENAPAMQLADAFEVFPMLDGKQLRAAVERHKPDVIVPEL